QQVLELIAARGGPSVLLEDCATIAAYHSNLYQPLLRRFYKSHRQVLFEIARLLQISSTTQDQALCQALAFVLAHRHKRSEWLRITAEHVDQGFPENKQLTISAQGEPVLGRLRARPPSPTLAPLRAAVDSRLPQRHLIDIVRNVEHWTHWSRHFGPLSGSDP